MKKIIYCFLMIFFSCLMIYSIVHIVYWFIDNRRTNYEIERLQGITFIDKKDEPSQEIDFDKLETINDEVVGWIQVDGTNVNYPYVQHSDNSYYLNHSFYKDDNSAGWVYLDYRNKIDFSDSNTILYAHGRVDGTMFGSLKNSLNKDWYDRGRYNIYVYTKKSYYTFKIFSLYHIKTTDDYLSTYFKEDDFYDFINRIKQRSAYDFDVDLDYGDKIITLSTCYNEKEKMVVHAKLVD